jgi:replicative DNA helicase
MVTQSRRGRIRRGVGGSTNTSVEVLLAETVPNLGQQGEIVRVKPGYARNYLLPHGLATVATENNKRMVQRHKERLAALEAERIKQLRGRADALSKYSVTLEALANDEGHLYGSILANDISKALKAAGHEVEPDHLKLEGPLKELGMYTIRVELHPQVKTDVKVWVVPAASLRNRGNRTTSMATAAPTPAANPFDRVPPANLDAERCVLGSLLLLNESIDEVADFLTAQHFYSDRHQAIYTAISELYEAGVRGIDVVTLSEQLEKHQKLEEVGGPAYLLEILQCVPHAAHAKYYATIVREKAVQRSLITACTEILRDCYEGDKPIEDVLQAAEQNIFRILEQQESAEKISIDQILLDAWARIEERTRCEGGPTGLPTGFVDLDAKTNGFQPSELIILAARPSMGKTALVCNWAEAIAESGRGVLVFSLEQSKLELAERFLCIRARVDGHRLRSGLLDDAERHRLMVASSELNEMPLFIDDRPGRTVSQIAAIARRIKRQHGLGIVIVDYLQLVEPEDKRAPREQQIAYISRRLKFIAKELDIPVVALAQLNRGVELREDKRPRLADLRESGAIEQDADLISFLHRPSAYDPEDRPGEAEVIIAKHRSGPTGIVTLTWRPQYMRFEDYAGVLEPEGGYNFGDP